jgi:hypothetical protein
MSYVIQCFASYRTGCCPFNMADRRAAVSGLAFEAWQGMVSSGKILHHNTSTSHSHFRVTRRPFPLISTLKEETNLCSTFFYLLRCVEVVEMTDFRKHNLPFCLKIDTKGGCTIYCRSFSSLKCLEVVKKSAVACVLNRRRGGSHLYRA